MKIELRRLERPRMSSSRIVVECCTQCHRERGDWHDKDCGVGRMGPGRVKECPRQYLERTVYVSTNEAAIERATDALFQSGVLDEIADAAMEGRLDNRDVTQDAAVIVGLVVGALGASSEVERV